MLKIHEWRNPYSGEELERSPHKTTYIYEARVIDQ